MGRSASGSDSFAGEYTFAHEQPEHPATVASFIVDKYEVTVGRFRKFVAAYDNWIKSNPVVGAGKHPEIANSGWGQSWSVSSEDLPATAAALKSQVTCNSSGRNWTDLTGSKEGAPMNCLSWYVAFAFCLWDKGRLPTEAEWEYVAAGGGDQDGNRLYPWGSSEPTSDHAVANAGATSWGDLTTPVGSRTAGHGRWGHEDLAGSMNEWTLDWYGSDFFSTTPSCTNCANLSPSSGRIMKGGSWITGIGGLRAAYRVDSALYGRYDTGLRCAR